MKAKLEDVARQSGVSIATVSRVLNNHPVKEETRIRVEEAIQTLNYRPNLQARALINGRHNRVGIMVTSIENPYSAALVNAISKRLMNTSYQPTFINMEDTFNEQEEIGALEQLIDSGIDGIILADTNLKSEGTGFLTRLGKELPLVNINGNPDRRDLSNVMADQAYGMDLVMDHLLSLGHKKIAFLRGGNASVFDIKEKVFRGRMKKENLGVPDKWVVRLNDAGHSETVEEAQTMTLGVLSEKARPTAFFCSNEIMAMGLYKAARKLNIRIPEDLSVIAQDNTFVSSISEPELTTIDINPSRLGTESAEMLLQIMAEGVLTPRKLIFYPEIIIRKSCGPA